MRILACVMTLPLLVLSVGNAQEPKKDPSDKNTSPIFKELRSLDRTVRQDKKDSTPIGNHVAFSLDGKLALASSSEDAQIFLSDAQTWKVVHRFKGHDGLMATALAFSPDGKRFASGGYDGRVWIWDIELRKEVVKFEGHRTGRTFKSENNEDLELYPPDRVIFSPDGKQVFSFSSGHQAWLWDSATGKQLHRLNPEGHGFNCAAYSRDGRWIVASQVESTTGTKEIVVLDTQTGKEARRLAGKFQLEHLILDLAVTASGKHVVACCHDATIRTWEIESGKEIKRLPVATKDVLRGFALSRDGRLAITWDQKMTKKWTTERTDLGGGRFEVTATQKLLPDGDPTVHLWDVEAGKLLGSKTYKGPMYTSAFSPDGRQLLIGAEKQVQVWELVAGSDSIPGK